MAYQTSLNEMLAMFVDNTAGETFNQNRLITTEDGDNVALIAYGWLKIAEYNESRDAVTVFTGHQSLQSVTVSRWMNRVTEKAENRGRDVILSGESPTTNPPNSGADYIGEYVSFTSDRSEVEKQAVQEVVDSLKHVA
jgi:hypothetical protein